MIKGCLIEGCEKKHGAKGYCWNHYVRSRYRANKLIVKINCIECNIEFDGGGHRKKFCSSECTTNNVNRRVREENARNKKIINCLVCGTETFRFKYCSAKCSRRFNKKKYGLFKRKDGSINESRLQDRRLRRKAYKKRVRQCTPKWVIKSEILEIYKNCPDGMHVDHIVPINGENVSGLHVPANLQYLTAEDNIKKSNKVA